MDKYDRTGLAGIEALKPILQQISNNQQIIFPNGSASDKKLQHLGMDVGFINHQGQLMTIEVKTVNSENTHIFVELITDIVHPRMGWFYRIEVDLLAYINLASNFAILMKWIPAKSWIETYIENNRKKLFIQMDERKSAVGMWIPLQELAHGIDRNNFGTFNLGQPELWQGTFSNLSLVA